MKIRAKSGKGSIATVYIAEFGEGEFVEFVESVQPPIPRDEKWVIIVSTLFGCPVVCRFCDAGGFYKGRVPKQGIFDQIDYLIDKRYTDRNIPAGKFKIQFARMGDPVLNPAVLEILEELPSRYNAPGLMPSISTVAPHGCDDFLSKLAEIKERHYKGKFQMQFSIHSTDQNTRDWIIPVKKWGFSRIATYGEEFFREGDRKITLNFALAKGTDIEQGILLDHFDPAKFLLKITPVNPTFKASDNAIVSSITPENGNEITSKLRNSGYDVILSIGELKENGIGSNCGQHLMNFMGRGEKIADSYTTPIEKLD